MIRRPPRSTRVRSSAASDVYKRQVEACDDRAEGRLACAVLSEQGVHLPSGEAEVDVGVGEYSVEGLVDVPELDRRWDFALWSIRHRDRLCLLYTSDAADDLTRVDLGGRRIIKK